MKSIPGLVLIIVVSLLSAPAIAQQSGIGSVKVTPNPVRAGQPVDITISADGEAPSYCGMVVHFDDGSESRNIKIDSSESLFPVSIAKTYAKAGKYSIKAEGKKITNHFPCVGSAKATLVVEAAPAAPSATSPAAACPKGYKMIGRMGKAHDFSCKGGKGAKAPETILPCANGLEYFFNAKTRQLGCRKLNTPKK
ncbi:MAG: hypothetical protein K9J74_10140 [Sulfuritalea sp.]|nr:hypothetical protein [Sulfuritalea sp.]